VRIVVTFCISLHLLYIFEHKFNSVDDFNFVVWKFNLWRHQKLTRSGHRKWTRVHLWLKVETFVAIKYPTLLRLHCCGGQKNRLSPVLYSIASYRMLVFDWQGCHAAILERLYDYMPLVFIFLALDLFQVRLFCPPWRQGSNFSILRSRIYE